MEEKIKLPSLSLVFFLSITTYILGSVPTGVAALKTASKGKGIRSGSSVKLFVFGDSYADTGNWEKSSGSWHMPYGSTYPGKPTGRFSDGLVLTDYIASFLGIRSPVPYEWRNYVDKSVLKSGMNFAHGGTGVFNTMVNKPNMTAQIDMFQQLLEENVYTRQDLSSSIGLVSLAGNDYASYASKSSNEQDLSSFTTKVVNQLVVNLKRIRDFGVSKIAVTALEPLGCLPQLTAFYSYMNCSEMGNRLAQFHNKELQLNVQKLQNQSGEPVFVILDLHRAFESAFNMQVIKPGNLANNPLKPCCTGVGNGYACGSLDEKGTKKYVVCDHPEKSFFWDNIHPSHNGWRNVYTFLRPSLYQLY